MGDSVKHVEDREFGGRDDSATTVTKMVVARDDLAKYDDILVITISTAAALPLHAHQSYSHE